MKFKEGDVVLITLETPNYITFKKGNIRIVKFHIESSYRNETNLFISNERDSSEGLYLTPFVVKELGLVPLKHKLAHLLYKGPI